MESKMQQSTIFELDGNEFVRKHTTLVKENGSSGVGTTLEHNNPGYSALLKKESFTGTVTLFGKTCSANYAPLTDSNGVLTGALMVCLEI
jgi:methyl-accepting chemotaxis protein